jgi:hypothetical protein
VAALISSGHRSADDGDGRRKRRDGGIGEAMVEAPVSARYRVIALGRTR